MPAADPITRENTLALLRAVLEPLPWVHTMWEGGSRAFGRDDELSDIDLQLDVDADRVADAFAAVESALQTQGPLALRWVVPEPTWHGYAQRFYRVEGAPEFLYVDLLVRALGKALTLTEREQHGEPVIHFDKLGMVHATDLDWESHLKAMRRRGRSLIAAFPMLTALARKEVLRNHPVDAAGFYHSSTLRPLVELLRMVHCPERYTFGLRYVQDDLPDDVVRRLRELSYPGSPGELEQLRQRAAEWFAELAAGLDFGEEGADGS